VTPSLHRLITLALIAIAPAALAQGPAPRPALPSAPKPALQLQLSDGQRSGAATPADGAAGQPPGELASVVALRSACPDIARKVVDTPLKLAEVLRAVVCANAGVRQGEGLTLQAQAALQRARATGLPRASVNLQLGSDDSDPAEASAGLRLDWVLYDFGGQRAAVRQGEAALQALSGEIGAQALSALGNAAQLHAAAVSAFNRFDAAATNLRIAGDSARLTEARQGAGAATLSDKLQARTALGQAQVEHARAQSQWLVARGALAAAMALPADTPLNLASSESLERLETERPLDLTRLADEARQGHPRVLAARARVVESRFRGEAAAAERWGTVNLGARTARGRTLSDGSSSRSSNAALEWSIPLFDGGVQRSRETEAQGQRKVREIELEEAERQVALQVWQAGQALAGEQRSALTSRAVTESAEGALRAASERYRLGAGSFADLLSAQSAAAAARLQRVETQSSLLLAHLRLAAALGRLVDPATFAGR
jgi:outer membrane protein